MFELVASIEKADIRTCGGMKGSVNLGQVRVGGRDFDAGKLRYCGFAGGLDLGSGKYVGHNRFTEVGPEELSDPLTDFEMIPGGLTGEVHYGVHARDDLASDGGQPDPQGDGEPLGG